MKVVSFAIWGNAFLYWHTLPSVVKSTLALYPGWQIRIHTDAETYKSHWGKLLQELQLHKIIEVRVCDPAPYTKAMMWRLLPLWDKDVEVVICRDMDSIPTVRERDCVGEFMISPCIAHGINDHPCHTQPLMGGMCGFKKEVAANWTSWQEMISVGPQDWNVKGNDQFSMHYRIWPVVKTKAMIHKFEGNYQPDAAYVLSSAPQMPTLPQSIREGAPAPKIGLTDFDRDKAEAFYSSHIDPKVNQTIDEAKVNVGYHAISRYVLFSTDVNKTYAFYSAMTAKLWKRCGYNPVCVVVGTQAEWLADPALALALNKMIEVGTRIVWVPAMEGQRTGTVAQNARLYAGAIDGFWDQDYILTADVDMWPLNRDAFLKNKARVDRAHMKDPQAPGEVNPITRFSIWFSNAYTPQEDGLQTYPICYLGSEHWSWRQVMNVKQQGRLAEELQSQLDNGLGRNNEVWKAYWNYDERLFGLRFKEWLAKHPEYATGIEYFQRHGCPPNDRIDRWNWKLGDAIDITGKVDAHMPRNDLLPKCRSVLQPLVGADYQWYESYMTEFFKLAGWPNSK